MSELPSRPRLRVQRRARPGEVIELRALMDHPMETGIRTGGGPAPARDMLESLVVTMNGAPLVEVAFRNGASPNPFHVFHAQVEQDSLFRFTWTDEAGRSASVEARVGVG